MWLLVDCWFSSFVMPRSNIFGPRLGSQPFRSEMSIFPNLPPVDCGVRVDGSQRIGEVPWSFLEAEPAFWPPLPNSREAVVKVPGLGSDPWDSKVAVDSAEDSCSSEFLSD